MYHHNRVHAHSFVRILGISIFLSFSLYLQGMSLEKAKENVTQLILYKYRTDKIKLKQRGDNGRRRLDLSKLHLENADGIATLAVKDGSQTIALCNAERLQLILSHNLLQQVPHELTLLGGLEKLKLSHNRLEKLESPLFLLVRLKKLSVAHNKIQVLPEDFSHLTGLIALDLSHNHIKSFPEVITNLTLLKKLSLAGNKIPSISQQLTKLNKLAKLDLSATEIPLTAQTVDTLGRFLDLFVLKLNNNNYASLPDTIGKWTCLEELHFDHNKLRELPAGLELLNEFPESLKQLCLRSQYRLPDPRIRTLHLSYNCLSHFPNVLNTLTTLKNLYLDHNQLGELPCIHLDLVTLDLSANKLTSLLDIHSTSLACFFLNNNNITHLPQLFPGHLCCLEIRHNKLTKLPEWLTECSNRLARLDLCDNRLGVTKDGIYQPVLSLDDIAMFQPSWWSSLISLGQPSPIKIFLEKLIEDGKKYGPILTYFDPFGYLTLLPKEILYEVYRYLIPPATTSCYMPSDRCEMTRFFFLAEIQEKYFEPYSKLEP